MLRARSCVWVCSLTAVGCVIATGMATAQDKRPPEKAPRRIVVTTPLVKDVVLTQQYVGKIHAQRHIDVRALATGYIESVLIKEGQAVKKGEVLFRVLPTLYRARLEVARAELQIAQLEYENTKKLYENKVVSQQEVELHRAKLARASAKAELAEAQLNFTQLRAPFDGFVGRLQQEVGSLVKKKDILTTLSDTSVVWVYFKMSEARYLEYRKQMGKQQAATRLELVDSKVDLKLADGSRFGGIPGNIVTVESMVNNEFGGITCRVDFLNPDRLLWHGQTGSVIISRTVRKALVIPQKATFEAHGQWFVNVVGPDGVTHQREIVVKHEVDALFVINKGLVATDLIILNGTPEIPNGSKVEYEFRRPEEVFPVLKHLPE